MKKKLVPVDELIPEPVPEEIGLKSRPCAEETCELKVYCLGWCHTHFLARYSVSTKKAKSEFDW